jgi:hypothetical protein
MRTTTATTMTAATTVAATLRPHRQRQQHQAKRRSGQPAPHVHIITQSGRDARWMTRKKLALLQIPANLGFVFLVTPIPVRATKNHCRTIQ